MMGTLQGVGDKCKDSYFVLLDKYRISKPRITGQAQYGREQKCIQGFGRKS